MGMGEKVKIRNRRILESLREHPTENKITTPKEPKENPREMQKREEAGNDFTGPPRDQNGKKGTTMTTESKRVEVRYDYNWAINKRREMEKEKENKIKKKKEPKK